MKRVLVGALIALASVLVYKSCADDNEEKVILREESMLIQQQLSHVSKLIVSESHFSEIYSYKDSRAIFGELITADKKALVVVNAEVSISYDLSQLTYELDADNKMLRIGALPEPEININPDFEYYDISAAYFNPFEAGDYNAIKKNVKVSLIDKIKQSKMMSNAENRLLSELSRIYALTNTLGWTLVFDGNKVDGSEESFHFGKTLLD